MAEPILTQSLTPTASPVDRFAAPSQVVAKPSGLTELAQSLSRVNPKLQKYLGDVSQEKAAEESAAGVAAEAAIDPSIAIRANQEGWQTLISEARKADKANGTDTASQLLGSSPHFRRGLVKARTQRIGLGLDNHLQKMLADNVDGVRDMDDPVAVQEWVQAKAQEYSEANGILDVDPVITAETYLPRMAQATDSFVGRQQEYRAKKRIEEYTFEMEAGIGMALQGGGTGASDPQTFINRLMGSESSGRSGASNNEVGSSGRRGHYGNLQFGHDRLDEARAAGVMPKNMTAEQFLKDEAVQARVNLWHIRDIDKHIDAAGYLAKGWSLDGLRAVAHLGGKGGMDNFVMSNGSHNPSDSFGTSLSNYYNKFSSPAGELQSMADEAVVNGVDPTAVNKTIVASVIAQAEASGDVSVLGVLNELDTGYGPLGNVGWVKAAVEQAETQIENANWREEERQWTREKRAEAEAQKMLQVNGFREIYNNPDADISGLVNQALDAGFPDLAMRFEQTKEALEAGEDTVSTNQDAVIDLNRAIYDFDIPEEQLANRIDEAARAGQFPASTARSLYQQLEQRTKSEDYLNDSFVQREIGKVEDLVLRNRTVRDDLFGTVLRDGTEDAVDFRDEVTDAMLEYLETNPEATQRQFRNHMRSRVREIGKQEVYQKITVDDLDTQVTDSDMSQALLEQKAEEYGITVEEVIENIKRANQQR